MTGIILEGIPGCGKAQVLRELRGHPRLTARGSMLVLSSPYTERAIEHRIARPPERYEQLVYRLLAALEPLRVLTVEGSLFARQPAAQLVWLFERFHLTNVIRHGGGDPGMLKRMEGMMRFYNPQTVLLTLSADALAERVAQLPAPADPAALTAQYLALQQSYVELAARSTLPTHTLVVDELGVAGVVNKVAELLG